MNLIHHKANCRLPAAAAAALSLLLRGFLLAVINHLVEPEKENGRVGERTKSGGEKGAECGKTISVLRLIARGRRAKSEMKH